MTTYHLYGLVLDSEFTCPELAEANSQEVTGHAALKVEVRRAHTSLSLEDAHPLAPWMRTTPEACLFEVDGIARFLIERAGRITIEMMPGVEENDMRSYLFGTAVAALCHMKCLVPLHLSALLTPDGVMAFTGPSGAGKSTTVAKLHMKHGWPIVCDDVAVLHPSDDEPLLHAGMNRIKLWTDAVERLGIDRDRLTRDLIRTEKFHLCAPEMFADRAYPISRLVEIRNGGEIIDTSQDAAGVLKALMGAIYRPELVPIYNDQAGLFACLAKTAAHLLGKDR